VIRYHGQDCNPQSHAGVWRCLCYLLGHPARDVHASELLAHLSTSSAGIFQDRANSRLQANAQYKHRIDELRNDLEEAKRFNDSYRATKTRSEMDDIAEQTGRCRRSRRQGPALFVRSRRARSAVTKADQRSHRKNQRGHAQRSPPLWPRESRRDTSAPTTRTRNATSPGSSDFFLAFPAVVTRKVTV